MDRKGERYICVEKLELAAVNRLARVTNEPTGGIPSTIIDDRPVGQNGHSADRLGLRGSHAFLIANPHLGLQSSNSV